jgi:hypothetical protein
VILQRHFKQNLRRLAHHVISQWSMPRATFIVRSVASPFARNPGSRGARALRSPAQAFYDARLALGQRMYRAGIDDGQHGVQIGHLDERINRATATQAPSNALKLQQQKLILQLADSALAEEGPLPGADAEYQTARKLEVAFLKTQIPRSVR